MPKQILLWKEIKHRICRIYPFYALILVGAFAMTSIFKRTFAFKDLLFHGLFFQNFYWLKNGYESLLQPFTAHTWTLAIEMWLFFLWLIAFRVIRNKEKRILFNYIVLACAIIYRVTTTIFVKDPMVVSLFPLAHADAFAIGSLLALDMQEKKAFINMRRAIFFIVIGVLLVTTSIMVTAYVNRLPFAEGYALYSSSENYLNHWFTCNIYLYISIISIGLVYLFHKIRMPKCKVVNVLAWCGDYTYGAYLLHWPVRVILLHVFEANIFSAMLTTFISLVGARILENVFSIVKGKFEKV